MSETIANLLEESRRFPAPEAFAAQANVGPGEHAGFPSKWMSADGTTLHLVFSGDDAFSVRRATIKLR